MTVFKNQISYNLNAKQKSSSWFKQSIYKLCNLTKENNKNSFIFLAQGDHKLISSKNTYQAFSKIYYNNQFQ
jgi:hypothetical protein